VDEGEQTDAGGNAHDSGMQNMTSIQKQLEVGDEVYDAVNAHLPPISYADFFVAYATIPGLLHNNILFVRMSLCMSVCLILSL